jgi:hypothetical protein
MVQAGAVPVTWQQVLLEYQRDWSRKETYDAVMDLVREHSGAYGMGVDYAYTMVHGAPERKAKYTSSFRLPLCWLRLPARSLTYVRGRPLPPRRSMNDFVYGHYGEWRNAIPLKQGTLWRNRNR